MRFLRNVAGRPALRARSWTMWREHCAPARERVEMLDERAVSRVETDREFVRGMLAECRALRVS
jgi:hypothetical protein